MNRKSDSWLAVVFGVLIAGLALAGLWLAGGGERAAAQGQHVLFFPTWQKKYCNGPGTLRGKVVDATTKLPPEARARVYFGSNLFVWADAATGEYVFPNLPGGQHTFTATADYYFLLDSTAVVRGCQTTVMNFAIYPSSPGGQRAMRVILTWRPEEAWPGGGCPGIGNGNCPNDLDTHMWVVPHDPQDPSGPKHINAGGWWGDCSTFPSACLDFDDQRGSGPETLSVRAYQDARYSYAILNYNQAFSPTVPPIRESRARVIVYWMEGGVWQKALDELVPTAGEGDMWYVFSMDVSTETVDLTPQNCIMPEWNSDTQAPPDCPNMLNAPEKVVRLNR
jgi:hypothetical protein